MVCSKGPPTPATGCLGNYMACMFKMIRRTKNYTTFIFYIIQWWRKLHSFYVRWEMTCLVCFILLDDLGNYRAVTISISTFSRSWNMYITQNSNVGMSVTLYYKVLLEWSLSPSLHSNKALNSLSPITCPFLSMSQYPHTSVAVLGYMCPLLE